MNTRICKLCNEEFKPKSPRQYYCKKQIEKICPVCGDTFYILCQPTNPTTCSKPECKKKAGYIGTLQGTRKCKICGSEFKPTSSTQQYCNKELTRVCVVCGSEFIIQCTAEQYKKQTCSEECMNKLASNNRMLSYSQAHIANCAICGKEFHPVNNTQVVCTDDHFRECAVCGKEFKLEYKKGMNRDDLRITCSEECHKARLSENNAFKRPEVQEKIKQTMLEKYGVAYPAQSLELVAKMFATYKDKTGYDHPSHNPNTLKGKNLNISSIEERFKNVLCNNRIDFISQKQVSKGDIHHKFDFYLPKYKMYVDIDGMYYHGYLDDSNGWQIDEDRDNKRLVLLSDDELYTVIPEIGMNKAIQHFLEDIKSIDNNTFSYEDHMFNWCRSIEFPYPEYNDDRLKRDYRNLCKCSCDKYNPHSKLSISTIRHFHKSVYDARVGNSPSIKDAWYDDNILKKVIHNRMIYRNDADPSKILAGFYISKLVPKVSIFNPVLARYLTLKYLPEFDAVADPFSGFSGRLLGVASTGKEYEGSDINIKAIEEANSIIEFHDLKGSVKYGNVLQLKATVEAQCLLTCPPYGTKEKYSNESEFKTCDEWIVHILSKYDCKRYVFVVDHSDKYTSNIVEEIITPSYFNDIKEYVIVIDNN